MNLTENYLMSNGYDYFGNAAEDTLVFFVRDESAPYAEPDEEENAETNKNSFNNAVKMETRIQMLQEENSSNDGIIGSTPKMSPWI